MRAKAPDNVRRRQVDDHPPDLAAVMMARAMAEMFQDEPGCRMPEAAGGHPAADEALGR